MSLQQEIEQALKDAMREKNENKRNAVRLLLTVIKVKEKELRRLPNVLESADIVARAGHREFRLR